MKNLLGDRMMFVDNYQQTLKKLRDDFLSAVIVGVETNVFRILAGMGSIHENINEVNGNVKGHGRWHTPIYNSQVGVTQILT